MVPFPPKIGNMKNLSQLNLHNNKLVGLIPSSLGHVSNLASLTLSSNQINGSIHPEIGNMKNLIELYINNNNIVGQIPSTIGHLTKLQYLYLDWNQISGFIPKEVENCSSLWTLSLSHNHLTGSIPPWIKKFEHEIDLIYNNLIGKVPNTSHYFQFEQFKGNKDLCGDIEGFPPWPPFSQNTSPSSQTLIRLKILVPVIIFFVLLLFGCSFLSRCGVKKTKFVSRETKNVDLFSIWNYDGKIAYEDIIESTADFDIRYCIGIGGYGSVYKAQLPSGKKVVLKKLHRLEADDPNFD